MLVLSRRRGEKVRIGEDILVEILDVRGAGADAQVRIGIDAPRLVRVLREELYRQIQADIRMASEASGERLRPGAPGDAAEPG